MPSERVLVGRVVKPHGIRGEVVVDLRSDVPGRFDVGATLTDETGRTHTVASSRPHQERLLVRFEGVSDRNDAEALRGARLHAEPVDYGDSETYFAHELVGMAVVGEQGEPLGVVSDLIDLPTTAGYDLLEVERADGSTWLLPAVDEYVDVEETEDGGGRLRLVDPPAGLVDLDDAAEAAEEPEDPV